jgi:hypothetical protein
MRRFKLKRNTGIKVEWLNQKTIYEGKLMSMTARVVRLYAPDPADTRPHVDLSYDWVTPVR